MRFPAQAVVRAVRFTAIVACAVAGVSCSEPFAHVNPYDLKAPLELELVALQDSVFQVNEVATFHLVTRPAHTITSRGWSASHPDLLAHLGEGRFRVAALPANNVTVVVEVTVGQRSATAAVVVVAP